MPWIPLPIAFAEGEPGAFMSFVPILVIFAIFYFLLIAPMRKRQKAVQTMISGLSKGDHVVTTGGIHGEIVAVRESDVLVKIADNVKVRVSKPAIAALEGQESEGEGK